VSRAAAVVHRAGEIRGPSARTSALILGLAAAIAATTILWLNRGTTFWNDQFMWFGDASQGLSLLEPHNSHLIATTRLLYEIATGAVGADYLVYRLAGVIGVLAAATLYYAWARRRLGPGWALLPAILLLFLGSAWQHVVGSIGFTVTVSVALGIASLIALEGRSRGRDALARLLLTASILTYTVGLAYLVGIAIKVLFDRKRLRRLWVFLVPLLLYATWYFWAQKFDQGRTEAENLLHVWEFFARSAAIDVGALTGVNIPFSRFGHAAPVTTAPASFLGWVAAGGLVIALLLRFRAGGMSRSIWASLAILLTYWLAAALADIRLGDGTQVDAVRYVFPSTVGLLLVIADAGKGITIRRSWTVALIAVFAFSMAMNLVFLKDGGFYLRQSAESSKIGLAMVELRGGLEPGRDAAVDTVPDPDRIPSSTGPAHLGPDDVIFSPMFTGSYLDSVVEFGSPAYDLDQVRALPAPDRAAADRDLMRVGTVAISGDEEPPPQARCARLDGSTPTPLSPGDDYFKAPGGAASLVLSLGRFGDPPGVPLPPLPAGRWIDLAPQPDAAPEGWYVTLPAGSKATYCRGNASNETDMGD
jgi:hypothetical protein